MTTHGLSKTREYRVWSNIKNRCLNPKSPAFARYGARGIRIFARWRDDFAAFLSSVGRSPTARHTIDRINNGRGYIPGNVRWVTYADQNRNYARNIIVELNGEALCVIDWATRLGIKSSTVYERIRRGWSPEKALTTPAMRRDQWDNRRGHRACAAP